MFLTPEELITLTGRRRHDAQAKALKSMGIQHMVRADGALIVSSEHVRNLLGCESRQTPKSFTPNWAALA